MGKGLKIKIARIKANKKAIEVAKQLDISPSKLSLIENGHIDCPEETYLKLVESLNIR